MYNVTDKNNTCFHNSFDQKLLGLIEVIVEESPKILFAKRKSDRYSKNSNNEYN